MVLEALTKKLFKFQVGPFKKRESPKKLQQKKEASKFEASEYFKGI
jgi:hypothetical protein